MMPCGRNHRKPTMTLLSFSILQIINPLKRTLDNIKDPLFRYFEREVNTGLSLLNAVRQNLNDTILVCEAQKKPTNYLRNLMSDLAKGEAIHHNSNKTDGAFTSSCFLFVILQLLLIRLELHKTIIYVSFLTYAFLAIAC